MTENGSQTGNSDEISEGDEFIFRVPGHIKESDDWPIKMKLEKTGWYVEFGEISGSCVPSGYPFLYRILEYSWIEAPYKLRKYIEHLWHSVKGGKLSHKKIQEGFDRLTDWLKRVNEDLPEGSVWEEAQI